MAGLPYYGGGYPQMQAGYGYPGQMAQAMQQAAPQMAQQMAPQGQGLSGRVVTSREEALATPVDFMAGTTFLPDLSHGRIYVKVFNRQTGGADVLEFVPAPPAAEEVPKEDKQVHALAERVAALEKVIEEAQKRGAITASRRAVRPDD